MERDPHASHAGPDGFGEWRGSPTLVRRANASGPDTARRLWTVSEERTGAAFPERPHATAAQA